MPGRASGAPENSVESFAPADAAASRRPRVMRRLLRAAAHVLFWALLCAGAVSIGIALWVRRTFGEISIDQLLSNLPGGGGEGAGGAALVANGLVTGVVVPLAIVAVLAVLLLALRRLGVRRAGLRRVIGSGRHSRSVRVPGSRTSSLVARGVAGVLAVAVAASGAALLSRTIGVDDYVRAVAREATTGETLADYYVETGRNARATALGNAGARGSVGGSAGATSGAEPGGGERPNLVLIYMESIENTLGEPGFSERDMLAPIDAATEGWSTIPSLQQYEGGGWTMAGIVGTQCGIPLRTANSVGSNADLNRIGTEGHEISSYLSGADCLGDVLQREGYASTYMGGANADFAGKGTFLGTHGYSDVQDLKLWQQLGETEGRVDWGLSDRRLMDRAKDEVTRLHESEEPFNLTLLTVDTHEKTVANGYCDFDTAEAMSAAVECSMEQVAGFISYMRDSGYLDDTVVVVMGDHLRPTGEDLSFYAQLKDRDDRTIYNRIWLPDGVQPAIERDQIDQLSMYPTLLELLGVELPDHRAGIGVSALASADEVPDGTILDLSSQEYSDLVNSRSSDFYQELWGAGADSSARTSASAD